MTDLITKDPNILGGTPVIKGTRIPAKLLKNLFEVGYTVEIINFEYPSLSQQKILAFKKLVDSGEYVPTTKKA
jgi:uncharacterized protein (DUF433 family)